MPVYVCERRINVRSGAAWFAQNALPGLLAAGGFDVYLFPSEWPAGWPTTSPATALGFPVVVRPPVWYSSYAGGVTTAVVRLGGDYPAPRGTGR